MSAALLFVLLALTAFRVTRLLVADTIFDRPRAWVLCHSPAKFREGLQCPWCVGVWVSGALVGLALVAVRSVPVPLLMWGASAAVIGVLTTFDCAAGRMWPEQPKPPTRRKRSP